MSKLSCIAVGFYLGWALMSVFMVSSRYTLQTSYSGIFLFLTLFVTIAAFWQVFRVAHKTRFQKTQLALHSFALVASLVASGLLVLLGGMDWLVSGCSASFTSPQHHYHISIKEICLFDCSAYLYHNRWIFERKIALVVDDGGSICNTSPKIEWSADERRVIWTVNQRKGETWLP